jgi:hypothetical protein
LSFVLTTRRRNLAILAVVVLIAAGLAVWLRPRERADSGALGAVPRDAFLVITFDVAALRASPLLEPLTGGAAGFPGVERIQRACGWDPLARVKEIAVAVPEGGESGEFGVAATGDLGRDEFVACAEKVIRERGGQARVSTRGSFTLVDDAGATAPDSPKLAFKEGGPYLVGRGKWLDAMMAAAEGAQPALATNAAHASLRKSLASTSPPRVAVATAVLPSSVRERVRGEMGLEVDGGEDNPAMAGVLAVTTAGLALSTGPAGGDTELAAELRCETTQACDEVKKLVERKRLDLSKDFGARLVGLGPLIDSLTVEAKGTTLIATARAPTTDLARAVSKVLHLRSAPKRPPASSTPSSVEAAMPAPDEVVRPPKPRDVDAGKSTK